jgi:probable phosphoglycerate mutase
MNKKIYLIRHGEIDTGNEKKYVGITDLSLDNEGIEQAHLIKNYFSNIPIDKVYTSPLKRCLQTTEIILKEKEQAYTLVDDLKEINMGTWENRPIQYIKENFPKSYEERGKDIEFFIPPQGESFHQLAGRAMKAFERIVKLEGETIMIVAHAGINKVILSQILGYPLSDIFSIQQPYGCVNELTWKEETHEWIFRKII